MLWVRRSMRSMRSMQKASSLIAVIVGWSNNYESLRLLLSLCLLQRLLLSLCPLQRLLLSLCPLQRLLLSLCLLLRLLLSLCLLQRLLLSLCLLQRLLLSLCLLQRLLLSLCLLQRLLLSLCLLQRLLLSLCLLQRLLLSLLLGFPSYFFGLLCRFLGVLGLYHGTWCWGLFFLHHYRFGLLLCNSRSGDWELLLDWRRVLLDWCCIRYRLGLHCQRIHCLFLGVLRRTWCFDGPKGRSRRHYLLLVRSVRGV